MRCAECGAPNAETAQLCIRCEAPLARQRSAAEPAVEGSGGVTVARQRAPEAGQVVLEDAPSAQRAGSGSSRRRALVLAGAGLVVLAAATVVIVAAVSSVPSTSVSSARHLAEGQLRPGDCVRGSSLGLDTSGPWPGVVTVVPCTEQHLAEVFFASNVWPQSLAYPGNNEVTRQAVNRCDTALDAYVGRPDHLAAFTDRAIYPGSTVWPSGDRLVMCVAYRADFQPVDYSIKGRNA
jgi:Septum formation